MLESFVTGQLYKLSTRLLGGGLEFKLQEESMVTVTGHGWEGIYWLPDVMEAFLEINKNRDAIIDRASFFWSYLRTTEEGHNERS